MIERWRSHRFCGRQQDNRNFSRLLLRFIRRQTTYGPAARRNDRRYEHESTRARRSRSAPRAVYIVLPWSGNGSFWLVFPWVFEYLFTCLPFDAGSNVRTLAHPRCSRTSQRPDTDRPGIDPASTCPIFLRSYTQSAFDFSIDVTDRIIMRLYLSDSSFE
jgi:hypothetical protein